MPVAVPFAMTAAGRSLSHAVSGTLLNALTRYRLTALRTCVLALAMRAV